MVCSLHHLWWVLVIGAGWMRAGSVLSCTNVAFIMTGYNSCVFSCSRGENWVLICTELVVKDISFLTFCGLQWVFCHINIMCVTLFSWTTEWALCAVMCLLSVKHYFLVDSIQLFFYCSHCAAGAGRRDSAHAQVTAEWRRGVGKCSGPLWGVCLSQRQALPLQGRGHLYMQWESGVLERQNNQFSICPHTFYTRQQEQRLISEGSFFYLDTVELWWSQCKELTGTLRPVKIHIPAGAHVGGVIKCIILVEFMT